MRKKVKLRILSREKDQRDALLNALARGIVLNGKIKTTEAKAKEVSRFLDKQITIAKGQSLHARRNLAKNFSPDIAKKMIEELAVKYKDRPGGYTRITKIGPRKTDGAKMAFIELV